MYERDGWPMYSWYDRAAIWALGTSLTLGWRIVNLGNWLVRKSHEVRERHYPSSSSGIPPANDDSISTAC